MRSPHIVTKSSPRLPQLEKTHAQQRRPNTDINKINKLIKLKKKKKELHRGCAAREVRGDPLLSAPLGPGAWTPRHSGPRRCSTKAEPVQITRAEEKGGGTWPGFLPKEKPPGTGQPTPGVKATLRTVSALALGPATALSPQPGW